MSTIIKVRCTDQVLTFENTPIIASGGLEEDFVSFAFCSKWDGLGKTAVFWRSEADVYHVVLNEDNACPIPPEVLTAEGVIYFGVFGVNAEGKQRTSEILRYNIAKGAITEGTQPSDPTPDIYTQLLAYYADAQVKYEAAQRDMAEHAAALNRAAAEHAAALDRATAEYAAAMETMVQDHTASIQKMLDDAGKDLPNHIQNNNNPHKVTAEQVGAATPEQVADAIKAAIGDAIGGDY